MYLGHFGLARPPFKITPDPRLFYSGGKRGSVLDALVYTITSGEGITKVVGEVGSGKTMLCRMLETRLPPDVEIVYIANPSLSPENILQVIAFELRLGTREASKLEAMQRLQEWLLEQHAAGKHVVVFIEEAQSMPLATLEEIRLLSNLETDQSKLLQIVLFGQPELDDKLSQPPIRQLRERISHGFYLAPLTAGEIGEYLNFRMRSAGYHGPDAFGRAAARLMRRYSGGLIRRANILADKTLLAAFAQGTTRIAPAHVRTAARDSGYAGRFPWRIAYPLAGLALGALAGTAAWFALQAGLPRAHDAPASAAADVPAAPGSGAEAVAGFAGVVPEPGERANGDKLPATSAPSPTPVVARADPGQGALPKQSPPPKPVLDEPQGLDEYTLKGWLEAARDWVRAVPDQHYSIQLLTVSDGKRLASDLRSLAETIELDKVYVYETRINQQSMFGVLYKDYATRNEALAAIDALPDVLRQNRPFLRTVRRLREEIQG